MFVSKDENDFKDKLIKSLSLLPTEWALTPVLGKKAYRDGWQEEEPLSKAELLQIIQHGDRIPDQKNLIRPTGVGIRTGIVSGGLVAIDLDGKTARTYMLSQLSNSEELPKTLAWTSGRPGRSQHLYRVPEQYWSAIASKKFKTGAKDDDGKLEQVELRWNGLQSVLPPSEHPDTGQYCWLVGCSPGECDVAEAPQWVVEKMLKPAEPSNSKKTPHSKQYEDSSDIDKALSYLSALSSARAEDYDDWLAVGMALHSVDDSLLRQWDEWSRQSPKYKPGDCDRKWQSFKRSGVAIGTLAHMAKSDGWQQAKSNRFGGGGGLPSPVSNVSLTDRIQEILQRVELLSERKSAFINLSNSTKIPLRELEVLGEALESDADASVELADAKIALPKLLETQNQTIDPSDFLWGDGGKLAAAMKTVARAMPTSDAMIFTTVIPTAASRIGTSSRIIVKPSAKYKQSCIFWAAIVARSGTLKTPAQSVAIEPLLKLEIDAKKVYDADLARYEQEQEEWEKGDPKPKKPEPRKRYLTKDSTAETLETIHNANPRGILYYRDELAGMFKARNSYKPGGKGADEEQELDEWNGGAKISDRKAREIALDRTAISRTGSIQFEILQKIAADHDDSNGSMARWLFCAVKSPFRYIHFDDAPDTGISGLLENLYVNLEKLPTKDYLIDKDAQNAFKTWQHHLVDAERQENHPALKLIYPKIEGYTARFALWLHCVNAVLAGETPQASVDGKTMQKAVQLASFYLGQAKLLYAVNSPQSGLTGRLLKLYQFAECKALGITPRDVKQHLRDFRKLPTAEIKRDFTTLVEAGKFQIRGNKFIAVESVVSVVTPTTNLTTAKTHTSKGEQEFVVNVVSVGTSESPGFPKPDKSTNKFDNNDNKNFETLTDEGVNSVVGVTTNSTTSDNKTFETLTDVTPSSVVSQTTTLTTTDNKIEFDNPWDEEREDKNNGGGSVVLTPKSPPEGGGGAITAEEKSLDNVTTGDNRSECSLEIPNLDSIDNSVVTLTTTDNISEESENQPLYTNIEDNAQELKAEYILVQDGQSLLRALESFKKAEVLAIDVETVGGLNPHQGKIRLIQIAAANQRVVIADMETLTPSDLAPLRQLMAGPAIKIGHNFKFDWKFLTKAGLQPQAPYFDTMLASQLLTAGIPGKHSLKDVALKYLNIELNKGLQKSDWSGELSPAQLEYAALDAAVLLRLQEVLKLKLTEAELLEAAEIEFSAIAATGEMELSGILLDKSKWEQRGIELKVFLDGEAVELEKHLLSSNSQMNIFPEAEKINLNSHKQVLKALQQMGIPVESTGKQALIHLADEYPIINSLLEYKKHSKAVSSFCSSWSERIDSITGRIYSDYVQLGSANGRFSCRKPNLQQVPREKEVRSCFIPAPGHQLVIADYSQIELRVAAEISGDRRMIEAYRNGEDLHKLTASLVTGKPIDQISKNERQAAKAVNFGLIYGCGAKRLKQQAKQDYGVELSLEECETFRKRFFKAYRGVDQWHQNLIKSNLWETRTLSGRRRTWTDKQPWITGLAPAIVSGSASDIAKRALAILPIALEETGAKLVAFVHDEFILECPESTAINAAKILQDTMIKAGETYLKIVPVEAEVKIAESWADK